MILVLKFYWILYLIFKLETLFINHDYTYNQTSVDLILNNSLEAGKLHISNVPFELLYKFGLIYL